MDQAINEAPTEKFRVLLIEDDPQIARLAQVHLTRVGLECRHAHDARSGMIAFEDTSPHLVLLDIGIPGADGWQVCTAIRRKSRVPIIMMTARSEAEDQLRSFKIGADDYIIKPFDPHLMAARVVAQLRRTYRYDARGEAKPKEQQETKQQAAPARDVLAGLPPGWAGCDACNYMGPISKFERRDIGSSQSLTICPHCRTGKTIAFAIA
jgi:PleD family two-component response regulator